MLFAAALNHEKTVEQGCKIQLLSPGQGCVFTGLEHRLVLSLLYCCHFPAMHTTAEIWQHFSAVAK